MFFYFCLTSISLTLHLGRMDDTTFAWWGFVYLFERVGGSYANVL